VAGILEDGLWSLRDTGLSEEDKASVVLVISGYLRSEGTLTADLAATSPSPDDVMSGYRQLLGDAHRRTALSCYPRGARSRRVRHRRPSGQGVHLRPERILDGIEALIRVAK
jgi:hypothetical protein